MAVRKSILKLNHIEGVVKIINDTDVPASITIDIDVDLLKNNETLSGTTRVAISSIESSIATNHSVDIVRNGTTIMSLVENTNILPFAYGAERENETYDIVVNFSGKGTLYMRVLKESGFLPNFRPEQNGGY